MHILKLALFSIMLLYSFSAEAISVRGSGNMDFGSIASSDSAGTAVISPSSDSKSVTGGAIDFGGGATRAEFKITKGTNNGLVDITLPTSFIITKSGVTMTVNNLQPSITFPALMDNNGALTFFVGGTLVVPANQAGQSGLGGDLSITVHDLTALDSAVGAATVAATAVAPISISSVTNLDFGSISGNTTGGTLTVSPAGVTTPVNVTELPGGTVTEGSFDVTGEGGAAFSVTLPTSINISNGTDTMTVDNFQHDQGVTPTLSGGGSRTLSIGARLNVGASPGGGTYTGTYSVSVNYN